MTETGRYRLLLVDDNPINLDLLREVIAIHLPACRTVAVASGVEALACARELDFDGAFIDMQMPGMDGIELCRTLKQDPATAGFPIVLITAHQSTPELRAEGLDAGAHDFISQPIKNVELVARIKVMLRLRDVEGNLLASNQGLQQQIERKAAALRWMTGLIAAAGDDDGAIGPADLEQLARLLDADADLDFNRFRGEIFERFPGEVKKALVKLALLDEVPLPLAEELTEVPTIAKVLDFLERQNLFVSYERDGHVYRLREPLKGFLSNQVDTELAAEDVRSVFQLVADWWLAHQAPGRALELLLRCGDGRAVERLAREEGPILWGANALGELHLRQDQIFRFAEEEAPWSHLLLAIAQLDHEPEQGLARLQRLTALMGRKNDLRGELFSSAHQLRAHFFVDGDLAAQAALVETLENAFARATPACDRHLEIQATLFLALAKSQVAADFSPAQALERLAEFEETTTWPEYRAWNDLLRAHEGMVRGKWRSCLREFERLWAVECGHDLSPGLRVSAALVKSWFLEFSGQEIGRRELWAQLQDAVSEPFRRQTMVPLVEKLQALQVRISRGESAAAEDLLAELSGSAAGSAAPLLGMIEAQGAQLFLITGRTSEAAAAAERACRLLAGIGGFQGIRNALLMATVLLALDEDEACRGQLARLNALAGESTEQLPFLLGAWLASCQAGSGDDRQQRAAGVLEGLARNGLPQVPYWFSPVHGQLLRDAVAGGPAHRPLLDRLARRHQNAFLSSQGALLPLLKIGVLGHFQFGGPGRVALQMKDVSQLFRQLLALLIAAPDRQMGQDEIQALLWPESSAERSRSKFDSLLLRLRKMIEELLEIREGKSYLYLQKGVLSLDGCRVDAIEFDRLARAGLRHLRRREPWQAGLCFAEALGEWGGEFSLGVTLDGLSEVYRQELQLLYLDVATRYAELRLAVGHATSALATTRQALLFNATQEELVRLHRAACFALGLHAQAKQSVKDYAAALAEDGCDEEEIGEMVAALQSDDRSSAVGGGGAKPDPRRGLS